MGGIMSRAFGDPNLAPANFSSFSKQEIAADAAAKGLEQLEPFPKARSTAPVELSSVIGTDLAQKIQKDGEIVFHAVGDTGGIHSPQFQFAVADAMASDVANGAAFWYHLGDVVYYFGQDQYYFEQFYDPYRNYNAPIFAIPGNHDGAIFTGEGSKSLDAFVANFCTSQPTHNPDGQGVARTTMDQPGVYFTLNAPFVKFIGLYSNTGEGGTEGVISGPTVGNAQLDFLKQQLAAAKAERQAGNGARSSSRPTIPRSQAAHSTSPALACCSRSTRLAARPAFSPACISPDMPISTSDTHARSPESRSPTWWPAWVDITTCPA